MGFLVNKNPQFKTEKHVIHLEGCPKAPKRENSIKLDDCICPIAAENMARDHFRNVAFCSYCRKKMGFKD